MALSRSAARTARQRRWLLAVTTCGGAAGLIIVEGQLRERAQEVGLTTVEYAQERATEAVVSLRQASGVARSLLHTAVTSALDAVHQRRLDAGPFRAALATTLADLAADPPSRRQLVAWGGGPLLDWLLDAAYPEPPPEPGERERGGTGGGGRRAGRDGGGGGGVGSERDWATFSGQGRGVGGQEGFGSQGTVPGAGVFSSDSGDGRTGAPGPLLHGFGGSSSGSGGGGGFLPAPPGAGSDAAEAEGEAAAADAIGRAGFGGGEGGPAAGFESAVEAARRSREAERALGSMLEDDAAARLLLSRPGAVPRLLRAVAEGRASRGVEAALTRRAGAARAGDEAMTADLQEVVEVLRGHIGDRAAPPHLQRLAAGLLAGWAAGSAANRAKLTGLGLPAVLAEVMTVASGRGADSDSGGLQWGLLRLARVTAEHSSSADSHHLAALVLPLLYTAADATAIADAAMASYAVDTLAATVRHGGEPVASQVGNSTLPHLLWQLAKGMASYKTVAVGAASKPSPPAAGNPPGGGTAAGVAVASQGGEGGVKAQGAAGGGLNWFRWGWSGGKSTPSPSSPSTNPSTPSSTDDASLSGPSSLAHGGAAGEPPAATHGSAAAATAAGAGGSGKRGTSTWAVKDPILAAAVASAISELARAGLLPEAQVPRWRDWLLDVLCGAGFEPGAAEVPGSESSARAAVASLRSTVSNLAESASGAASLSPSPSGAAAAVGPAAAASKRPALRPAARGPAAVAPSSEPPAWMALPFLPHSRHGGGDAAAGAADGAAQDVRERERELAVLRDRVVGALGALSHMPGNHGLQAAHYWLSRLLSELAARTLPYTSLVYAEGPRDPRDLVHVVPVLPSYVRAVSDALERAADAVAEDSPPLPPHLEFELAGSGLVGRAPHSLESDRAAAAAYRRAAHVVDVVVAERKAADALEALCAIVAPDPGKQQWLLQRGVLPLLHRLTRTADDPRVTLAEHGQPGAEQVEAAIGINAANAAFASAPAAAAAPGTATATPRSTPAAPARRQSTEGPSSSQPPRQQQQQQPDVLSGSATGAPTIAAAAVTRAPPPVSELMSDHEGGPSLCLQRQVARMLALVALLPEAQSPLAGTATDVGGAAATAAISGRSSNSSRSCNKDGSGNDGWLSWLHRASASSDCRLSSNATRALLHAAAVAARAAVARPGAAAASATEPVFLDGIHLLNPGARHHWLLVNEAAVASAQAAATAAAEAVDRKLAQAVLSVVDRPPTAPEGGKGLRKRGTAASGLAAEDATAAAAAAAAAAMATSEDDRGGVVSILYDTVSSLLSWPQALLWEAATLAGAGLASVGGRVGGGVGAATAAGGGISPMDSSKRWLPTAAASAAEPLQTMPRAASAPAAAGAAADTAIAGNGNTGNAAATPTPDVTRQIGGSVRQDPLFPAAGPAPAAAAPSIAPYPNPYPRGPDSVLTGGSADAPPAVDVVFIHGIRGGPFITWRKAGVMTRGSAASHMERSDCWPSTWLAEDFPGARLLSVEYLAPVSAWEGESLPLEDNVSRVMGQLAAAGVGTGQRPVVFVAHSMGGLLVKEMLARSLDQAAQGGPLAALVPSTRGIVFFGTPHFGNAMAAMGWRLRHLPGAHPAPSLARLTPGPHLLALNERLRELHDAPGSALRVVSLVEGQPTSPPGGFMPKITVVGPESAYPGFGAAMMLPQNDHIDCCKPASKAAPAYKVVRDVVQHALQYGWKTRRTEAAAAAAVASDAG